MKMNLFSLVFLQGEIELSLIIEADNVFDALDRARTISISKGLRIKGCYQVFKSPSFQSEPKLNKRKFQDVKKEKKSY